MFFGYIVEILSLRHVGQSDNRYRLQHRICHFGSHVWNMLIRVSFGAIIRLIHCYLEIIYSKHGNCLSAFGGKAVGLTMMGFMHWLTLYGMC